MSGKFTPPGHTIQINGANLYDEEYGTGRPFILLHGGFSSGTSLADLGAALALHFRVFVLDIRGHGRSTNPAGELSYPLLADDVAALIAGRNLQQPIVGGWSDGGQIALALGAHHPDIAAALIVGAAAPDLNEPRLLAATRALLSIDQEERPNIPRIEEMSGGFLPILKSWHVGGERQWQALIGQTASMDLHYPGLSTADLAHIAVPTLILIGDRDEFIPAISPLPSTGRSQVPNWRSCLVAAISAQASQIESSCSQH